VKPGNLLLDKGDNIYVADFGIAHAAGVDSNTQTGVILGTAGYLAPEQAAGRRATAASDRFALAVVAHELLTGARPGPTPSSKLPPAARQVFARALDEQPEDRYPSCLDFVAALATTLSAPTAPVPATAPTAVMLRSRRRSVVAGRKISLIVTGERGPKVVVASLALGSIVFDPITVAEDVVRRWTFSASSAGVDFPSANCSVLCDVSRRRSRVDAELSTDRTATASRFPSVVAY